MSLLSFRVITRKTSTGRIGVQSSSLRRVEETTSHLGGAYRRFSSRPWTTRTERTQGLVLGVRYRSPGFGSPRRPYYCRGGSKGLRREWGRVVSGGFTVDREESGGSGRGVG